MTKKMMAFLVLVLSLFVFSTFTDSNTVSAREVVNGPTSGPAFPIFDPTAPNGGLKTPEQLAKELKGKENKSKSKAKGKDKDKPKGKKKGKAKADGEKNGEKTGSDSGGGSDGEDKESSDDDKKDEGKKKEEDKKAGEEAEGRPDAIEGSMGYVTSELVNGLNQILSLNQLKTGEDAEEEADEPTQDDANKAAFMIRGNGFAARAGNIAGVLGFKGDATSIWEGAFDYLTQGSVNAKNEQVLSYTGLQKVALPKETSGGDIKYTNTEVFEGYGTYGRVLSDTGISTLAGTDMIGIIGTYVLMLAYFLAQLVPTFFALALWLLDIFNPFSWLSAIVSSSVGLMKGAIDGGRVPSQLKIIAQPLADMYDSIKDLGIVVIAICIGIGAGLFFFGSGAKGKAMLKNSFIRLAVMVLGLGVVGTLYTTAINYARSEASPMKTSVTYADYLISTTYVNFKDWAWGTRLAPPDSRGNRAASADSSVFRFNRRKDRAYVNTDSFRQTIAAINKLAADGVNDSDGKETMDRVIALINTDRGGQTVSNVELDGEGVKAKASGGAFKFSMDDILNTAGFRYNYNLMRTYTGGSANSYSAGDFESDVQGTIKQDANNVKIYNGLMSLKIEDLENIESLMDSERGAIYKEDKRGNSTLGLAFEQYPFNMYNNGSLKNEKVNSSGDGKGKNTISYYLEGSGKVDPDSVEAHISTGTISGFGLSDLGMYNFLRSKFNQNSVNIVSMDKSSSGYTNTAYQSVTLAGTTVNGYLSIVEDVLVLAGLTLIGGMVAINMVKRSVGIVGGMFPAIASTGIGSPAGVVKLAGMVLSVVMYVFGSLFFYMIVTDLYVILIQLASSFGSGDLNFGVIGLNVGAVDQVGMMPFIARVLTIIFLIILIGAIRNGYTTKVLASIDKAVEGMVANVVDRLSRALGAGVSGTTVAESANSTAARKNLDKAKNSAKELKDGTKKAAKKTMDGAKKGGALTKAGAAGVAGMATDGAKKVAASKVGVEAVKGAATGFVKGGVAGAAAGAAVGAAKGAKKEAADTLKKGKDAVVSGAVKAKDAAVAAPAKTSEAAKTFLGEVKGAPASVSSKVNNAVASKINSAVNKLDYDDKIDARNQMTEATRTETPIEAKGGMFQAQSGPQGAVMAATPIGRTQLEAKKEANNNQIAELERALQLAQADGGDQAMGYAATQKIEAKITTLNNQNQNIDKMLAQGVQLNQAMVGADMSPGEVIVEHQQAQQSARQFGPTQVNVQESGPIQNQMAGPNIIDVIQSVPNVIEQNTPKQQVVEIPQQQRPQSPSPEPSVKISLEQAEALSNPTRQPRKQDPFGRTKLTR